MCNNLLWVGTPFTARLSLYPGTWHGVTGLWPREAPLQALWLAVGNHAGRCSRGWEHLLAHCLPRPLNPSAGLMGMGESRAGMLMKLIENNFRL